MKTLRHQGCDLAYRLMGGGSPVIFLQGVGLHGDGWRPQTDVLRNRYACLSMDNRGMAASQPVGPGTLTIEQMADDVMAVADTVGWDDFHLVGHSMGGHIATAVALAVPARVRSLALLCTSARGSDIPPVSASFLWTSLRSRIGPRRSRRRAFLELILPEATRREGDPGQWADRLATIFGHDLADTPPIVMRQVQAYRAFDPTDRLGSLGNTPTLVVSGTEDVLAPPALGSRLAAAIPGARFVRLDGAAHGLTVTHADHVNRLLDEHLAQADTTRHPGRSA